LASHLRVGLGRRRCLAIIGSAALTLGCTAHRGRVLRVWAHQGQEAEHSALLEIARAFNGARMDRRVEVSFFPDFQYTEKLAIAAAAADMPDAFELDGPFVARFVDAGLLAPIDQYFGAAERDDFLPTILEQGTIAGRLYAIGAFDSAAVLYFDRRLFEQAGLDAPDPERGFDWEELRSVCARLKERGIEPLALHMNESADEWYTYAFSPVIWSSGGALIGPKGNVRGVLASAQNVRSLRAWQGLFRLGYAQTDPVDPDPFGSGRVAMDWSGHWMLRSHLARKGQRLGVMPLPRTGVAQAAPCGSWCWGISARSGQRHLAAEWLRWVTSTVTGVVPMVRANGAVPSRRSAFAAFPEYERLPHLVLRRQLERSARPRPRTPFYATLTQRFAAALRDIAHGADVAERLARAEDEVVRVVERRLGRRARAAP
jgi:ABC-type glycerol-3-phosphate transport system substrate-binding protein